MTLEHKILASIAGFVILVIAFFLSPGSWYLQLEARPLEGQDKITAKVGEDVPFVLCREGIAVPVDTNQVRTTESLGDFGGSEYRFEAGIEDSGCEEFIHRANSPVDGSERIPQKPGTYQVTTNVFFTFVAGQKNTTYTFEFEYTE